MRTFEVPLYRGTVQDTYGNPVATPLTRALVKTDKGWSLDSDKITYTNNIVPLTGAYTLVAIARNLGNVRSPILVNSANDNPGFYTTFGSASPTNKTLAYLGTNNYKYFDYTPDNEWHLYIFTIPGDAQGDTANANLYIDGVIKALSTGATTTAQLRSMTVLGGTAAVAPNIARLRNLAYVSVYDEVISIQEINRLTKWFYELKASSLPKSNFEYPKTTDLSSQVSNGLKFAFNFIKNPNNTITDISGNGNTLSITGKVVSDNRGIRLYTTPATELTNLTNPTAIANVNIQSFQITANIKDISSSNCIYSHCTVNTSGFRIYIRNTKELIIQTQQAGGRIDNVLKTLGLTGTLTLQIQIDNTNSRVYVTENGVTTDYAITPYIISGTNTRVIGAVGGLSCMDTIYKDFRSYDRLLTTQELKDYHNNWAKQLVMKDCLCDYPADGVTRASLPNWTVLGGTFKVGEITTTGDALAPKGTKYIECVTAGGFSFPNNISKGILEFSFNRANGDTVKYQFSATKNRSGSFTASSGYYFYAESSGRISIVESDGLSSAAYIVASAPAYTAITTNYRVKIILENNGSFTLLMKGGSLVATAGYDGWTLVDVTGGSGTNPVIDTTYATSLYNVFTMGAGSKVWDFKWTNYKTV